MSSRSFLYFDEFEVFGRERSHRRLSRRVHYLRHAQRRLIDGDAGFIQLALQVVPLRKRALIVVAVLITGLAGSTIDERCWIDPAPWQTRVAAVERVINRSRRQRSSSASGCP